jgi:hypothetical protein
VERYDPLKAPDPEEWLELDEDERISLVRAYHRRKRIKLPNAEMHATMHALVEAQIAMGDELPVKRTLERLQREGLDRHDAVHAVANVLVLHLHALLSGPRPEGDPNLAYYAALEKCTAQRWLDQEL